MLKYSFVGHLFLQNWQKHLAKRSHQPRVAKSRQNCFNFALTVLQICCLLWFIMILLKGSELSKVPNLLGILLSESFTPGSNQNVTRVSQVFVFFLISLLFCCPNWLGLKPQQGDSKRQLRKQSDIKLQFLTYYSQTLSHFKQRIYHLMLNN